ncbi:glutamine-rich protein 2 [Microtus ochrogaster]|uniref:Glutamine-rich protein 2 n=1 Tax=Microtus ochrogaster TaxID=79684 RepID=A0ABM1U1M4_MICOH|nr:glutamine-rich protein 2 [Microtus ochrogaster]
MWDVCQQLLGVLFMIEEGSRILENTRKLVSGHTGTPLADPLLAAEAFPPTRSNWDPNTAEDGSSFVQNGHRYAEGAGTTAHTVIWAEALPSGTSAPKAELIALTRALQLGKDKRINVYTDSSSARSEPSRSPFFPGAPRGSQQHTMPPLAANRVTLQELADLAIGTPEVGAVNFTALHTLIVAILKSLNLQQVVIDFHSPSATEPRRSAESIRDAISTPQVSSSKEKRRSVTKQSSQQTLESQVKDLGSQVLDLSKQLKNMDNKVQGIAMHVEHISTGTDLFQEFPKTEEETALLAPHHHISPHISPQTSLTKPTKIYESTEMVDKSEPTVGMPPETEPKLVKTQEDTSPAKSSSVLQDLIEDVKVLKEAHQKVQESPELNVQSSDSSSATLGKRKMTLPISSDLPSGLFPKTPTDGQALGSTGGPEQMLASGVERPPERIVGRDQSRARDLPSRAREPSQVTSEADRQRMRESAALTGKRRDEQQPGPTPKVVPPVTDQHVGAPASQDQVLPSPEERRIAPFGMDQPPGLYPGPYPPAVIPLTVPQLGVLPPEMDAQGLIPLAVDESGVLPPSVPDGGQQRLEKASTTQLATVPLSMYQQAVILPSTDQPGMEQAVTYDSGMGPWDTSRQGLIPVGINQHGFVILSTSQQGLISPGVDQQGLVIPGIDQRVLPPSLPDQYGLMSPGLMQVSTDRQGFGQPSLAAPGFAQPGADQRGLVQPSVDQRGLVQPSVDQRGLVQPGVDQRGVVQPGVDQRGLVQPGVDQRGLVQPGVDQRGLVQPGVDQRGLVQPGVDPRVLMKTGTDRRAYAAGLMQPGIIQDSLVQPFVQPGADWSYAQPGVDRLDMAQPGAVQRGLVQPGTFPGGWMQPDTYSPGLVQPGIGQYGLVQPSVAQRGEDQRGLMQPVIDQLDWMQPGIDRSGSVPPGAEESSLSQPGMGQQGLAQPGMDQYGFVEPGGIRQPGAVQRGLVQPGSLQPRVDQPGLLQPRAAGLGMMQPGIVQPGAGPIGLVQPGAGPIGLVQPGVGPLGLVQPGVGPLGLVQPGVGPLGLIQSGVGPRGLVQPGMGPRGLVQPGAGPRGLVQPGAGPLGLVQPGVHMPSLAPLGAYPPGAPHPRGLRQPVSSQPGFVAPSIELRGFQPDLYLTPEQARQDIFPITDRQGPDHQGPRIQYDQTQAVLGYPSRGHTVDVSSQASWDPSRKHAFVQFELATTDQDTTDSSTRVSLSYPQQLSSGSEVHSERQESLGKLAPSFPMAVETFRLMGELVSLYTELKEHMKDLDEDLSGQSDLEKVQYLLSTMVKKTIPQDLQEQMKSLKTLAKEVRKEKDRLEKIQKLIDGDSSSGKEMKPNQLTLQLGILRVTVSDIEKELSELRESQERGKAAMENSVSEASLYLQDQLDKLRTIIESMLSSSSTLLSLSITPHKFTNTLVPGQIDPEATCPACSLDVGHQVSLLVQRYEQLQDMVSGLAASRPSKKAKLQSQDEELLGHVQSAILQVQGDCEKLNITTSNLIEDHRQKQKDIEVLYQGLERLEKEKADRDHLEMEIDVKADKSALASKVSRIQFDATTEQLNHMMQELVAKMSGQEQDWQKLLDKLLAEMDSKLDRLELDPLKQMLEDRWKSLRQQLKERSPLYQADEAAAMRRQLLAHFHCLSCDRPLETSVTGQVLSMTPVVPSMPGHRSIRPYTVFELEQVRQQSRNLKLGGSFSRGDLSQMERSVGRLRSMHSKMLMDIEKVQIHFGGSVKASSQMIRELMHAQCLSHPCYKRGVDTADYTYSTVPRRCGGSHTLTYPYRRNRPQHLSPLEEIQIAMKHDEVDILGLDGHIYKGRMDTRLPGILGKDVLTCLLSFPAPGMTKHKSKQLQQLQQLQQLHQLQQMQQLQQAQQAQHARPHVHRQPSLGNGGLPPSRPQSAQMLADSNSVPSGQKKDRPVSSEGRLSQLNVAHASIPTEMAGLQGGPSGLNVHMDVPPREGMEEPTRGPRSTTAH